MKATVKVERRRIRLLFPLDSKGALARVIAACRDLVRPHAAPSTLGGGLCK